MPSSGLPRPSGWPAGGRVLPRLLGKDGFLPALIPGSAEFTFDQGLGIQQTGIQQAEKVEQTLHKYGIAAKVSVPLNVQRKHGPVNAKCVQGH